MTTKVISVTTVFLVLLLAIGAFALSYNALQGVASENGLTGWQSHIWPLLIDFALIVFSLAVVRNALLGERTGWPWLLVFLYTMATIAFNVFHADDNLTAKVVALVAPVSLFLSFETLMTMFKSEVLRFNATQTLSALQVEADNMTHQITSLRADLDAITAKRDALAGEVKDLQATRRQEKKHLSGANKRPTEQTNDERLEHLDDANQTRQEIIDARRAQYQSLIERGLSTTGELASALDVSHSTVRRDLSTLNGQIKQTQSN